MFDFRGLRLDWARLQSYLSSGKGSVLEKQRELAALLNTVRWETIKCVYRIHMFLGLLDPDPSVRYGSGSGSGSFYHQAIKVRKTLIPTAF